MFTNYSMRFDDNIVSRKKKTAQNNVSSDSRSEAAMNLRDEFTDCGSQLREISHCEFSKSCRNSLCVGDTL